MSVDSADLELVVGGYKGKVSHHVCVNKAALHLPISYPVTLQYSQLWLHPDPMKFVCVWGGCHLCSCVGRHAHMHTHTLVKGRGQYAVSFLRTLGFVLRYWHLAVTN